MKKQDLLTALEIVKPGLANKEAIEQSTSFAFIKGRVVTYNDEISLSHPIVGLEITGAVQAEELYKLLRKIKQDEIEISISDKEVLLSAGRVQAGLVLQQEIKLPLEEIGTQGKWKSLPENFIKALKFAVHACSRELSKPVLTCIHIHKDGYVEGSDGFRITRYQLNEKIPVKTFLIPSASILELIKLPLVEIAEGEGWVHFRTTADTVMSCRVFEDKFPDTTPFLEVTGNEISFPKTINEILDRAAVFGEDIMIALKDQRIKISSESEVGWFEEEANVRYKGEYIKFNINPSLLKDILSETQTCIHNDKVLKFKGENWEYVTALRNITE